MKIWSRGLGKTTLDLNLGACTVDTDGDELVLRGKVEPPVNWEFWIRMQSEDLAAFMKIAMKKPSFMFVFKYVLYLLMGGLPREPNIGSGGRLFRTFLGVACILLAVFLPALEFSVLAVLYYLLRLGLLGLGILAVYVGLSGKCWLRFMGFRTPF